LATQEHSGLFSYKDAAGSIHILYPVTKMDNVEGMDELQQEVSGKQTKPVIGNVTIPTSGWGSDSTEGWPKYYDISVSGVAANDRANIDLPPAGLVTAAACGLCPCCETLAGKIRIRAVSVPTVAMTAQYRIEKG